MGRRRIVHWSIDESLTEDELIQLADRYPDASQLLQYAAMHPRARARGLRAIVAIALARDDVPTLSGVVTLQKAPIDVLRKLRRHESVSVREREPETRGPSLSNARGNLPRARARLPGVGGRPRNSGAVSRGPSASSGDTDLQTRARPQSAREKVTQRALSANVGHSSAVVGTAVHLVGPAQIQRGRSRTSSMASEMKITKQMAGRSRSHEDQQGNEDQATAAEAVRLLRGVVARLARAYARSQAAALAGSVDRSRSPPSSR